MEIIAVLRHDNARLSGLVRVLTERLTELQERQEAQF